MRFVKVLGIATVSCISLFACSQTPPPAPPKKVEPVKVAIKLNPATQLTGQLQLNKQGAIFTPCQGSSQYWVDFSSADKQLLERFADNSQLHVEMMGRFDNVSKQAPQADYIAKIVPESWQYLASEGPGCEFSVSELSAWGNEPSWRIDVEENKILLSTMSGAANQAITRSGIDKGVHFWQAGADLYLSVTKQQCMDTMADSVYSYTAELTYKGKVYQGCARRPFEQHVDLLAGYYQVKLPTASGSGRVVDLTLNGDFSAQLQNTYLEQDKSFVEKGYWYPLNQTSLEFTVSQSRNQQVKSDMIFDWDGRLLRLRNPESQQQGSAGLNMMKMNGPAMAHNSKTKKTYHQRSFEPATLKASSEYDPEVEAALKQYFKLHRTELNGTKYQWWKFDLNGDGKDEIISYVDWCGSGGCSLLIFEAKDNNHRFLSKTTLVHTPFFLATSSNARWQDLLIQVSGGGATPGLRLLRFDGLSYPLNPSVQPEAPSPAPLSGITFQAEAFSSGAGRALN
ncbi:membrane protein [Agarivorans sp. Toyoura001]|uniref:copper resistance protein NlpE N-terminal domain-containing protein n=1 Tax=Agarivorans sp. Toyoura001 TaxID=2283141 RepID=UPI0010F28F1E|nr:copper resistance protein NlpE N-terminal domain-containing protein [Agarivorans sp. Toyoura001]GDY25291.1 membrane protein [Agarivorans sp. Toyoura001]